MNMNKKQVAITLGIMCLLLAAGIAIQIRTITDTNSTAKQTLAENGLRDEVLRWKEKYDHLYRELEVAEKDLEKVRQEATQEDTTASNQEEEIKLNNMLLGLTDVTGPGIVISVKDKQGVTSEMLDPTDSIVYYLVHDTDLRMIVNELKNAGAEAISINNQRIVLTSSITCEGNIVRINGEKIGSPFTIKAIGNPERLYGALTRPEGIIDVFNRKVDTKVDKANEVEISKYNGVISSKFMTKAIE